MEDEKLLKISLITACVGLFVLFIIMWFSSEEVYRLEEVEELDENDGLIVYGKVDYVDENDKVRMFEIVEYKKIGQKALLFKENNESTGVEEEDYVRIKGTWYDGKIIIEEIRKIS